MPDAVVFIGVGSFLLFAAWWMLTHEHWAAKIDREGYESRPTLIRRISYLSSVAINRVVAPIALGALGAVAVAQGLAALF